jgi:hypothetical protein
MIVGTRSFGFVMGLAVVAMGPLLVACHDNSSSSVTPAVQPSSAQESPQASNHSVTLSWEAPTENSDGSALLNLKGYKIYYGNAPGALEHVVDVGNASLTRYVMESLAAGTYYFAVASYNALGVESSLSPAIATAVK